MTGAFAERVRIGGFLVLIMVWEVAVYYPTAHAIWGEGFLGKMGVLDFAGGIVIHTSAGVGSVCAAVMMGHRPGFHKYHGEFPPHNVPLAAVGLALLFTGKRRSRGCASAHRGVCVSQAGLVSMRVRGEFNFLSASLCF